MKNVSLTHQVQHKTTIPRFMMFLPHFLVLLFCIQQSNDRKEFSPSPERNVESEIKFKLYDKKGMKIF